MAQKKVWVSWMAAQGGTYQPEQVITPLQQSGLLTAGAEWVDDLDKLAWAELGQLLSEPGNADVWLLACDKAGWEQARNRYALSVLTAMLREGRGEAFPMVVLGLDFAPAETVLPTLLQSLQCVALTDAGWAAKVVAAGFSRPAAGALPDYRLGVRAHAYFGQWFEIGPRQGSWAGAMFGISEGGTITHHAVGPKGQVPERTVLEYPTQDIKATIGETAFTVWSAQNAIGPEESYYVRVEGAPEKIIFGGHPGTDQAEVSVVVLK